MFVDAVQRVQDACRSRGIAPGFHGGNVKTTCKRLEQGSLLVEACSNAESLFRAAAGDLKAMRSE